MSVNPDQYQEIRDGVRAVCDQFTDEYHREVDSKREYPEAFVKALTDAGWLSAMIPEEFGGSFILNLESAEENGLREDDGNYMLDVWIPPASALGVGRHPGPARSQG